MASKNCRLDTLQMFQIKTIKSLNIFLEIAEFH